MRIATVNVNGIRAAARKGFHSWLSDAAPDILLMQEVRAPQEIAVELLGEDYQTVVAPSELAGRAGVAIAVRDGIEMLDVRVGLPPLPDGEPPVDTGRWLEVDLQCLTVVSAYLHSGAADKPEKMAAKYAHLDRVTQRLAELASQQRLVLVAGDFNIVRSELDIKNWKGNHNKTSGVLDEEIAYLDRWMGSSIVANEQTSTAGTHTTADWVDVTRALAGYEQGPYTWWSNRGQAFDNNVGWRIDYHMASPELAVRAVSQRVDKAASYAERWSDHAPLVIDYEL